MQEVRGGDDFSTVVPSRSDDRGTRLAIRTDDTGTKPNALIPINLS